MNRGVTLNSRAAPASVSSSAAAANQEGNQTANVDGLVNATGYGLRTLKRSHGAPDDVHADGQVPVTVRPPGYVTQLLPSLENSDKPAF